MPEAAAELIQEPVIYGGKTQEARTVLLYGNCQVPFLAQMLATLDDLNDDYRFVVADSYLFPGESKAHALPDACLQDVALVLMQHEDRTDNPAWLALRARLPASCPVLTFPSFLMTSLWPFECPEPRGHSEPGYLWKRYPMGDMIGLRIAQAGLTGPLAVAAYLDLSATKMPNLAARLERDIHRMRRHDRQCDVQLADFVESRFQHEHLFWTNGHLSESAVAELARRVAAAARGIIGGTGQRTEKSLAGALGFGGMGSNQLPIHPIVAESLGLHFWQADMTYRWYSQHWTFFEYIERYIGYDADW
jgi:hypothetical protein